MCFLLFSIPLDWSPICGKRRWLRWRTSLGFSPSVTSLPGDPWNLHWAIKLDPSIPAHEFLRLHTPVYCSFQPDCKFLAYNLEDTQACFIKDGVRPGHAVLADPHSNWWSWGGGRLQRDLEEQKKTTYNQNCSEIYSPPLSAMWNFGKRTEHSWPSWGRSWQKNSFFSIKRIRWLSNGICNSNVLTL